MYSYSPFRRVYKNEGKKPDKDLLECVFCDGEIVDGQIIRNADGEAVRGRYYMWLVNGFPKFEGHTMLVPIAHVDSLSAEEEVESLREFKRMGNFAQKMLERLYPGCGIEFFAQSGEGSASSVEHIHWHIVPAQPDDKLRSFAKLGHFYTTNKDEKLVIDFPVEIVYAKEELRKQLATVIGSKSWSD